MMKPSNGSKRIKRCCQFEKFILTQKGHVNHIIVYLYGLEQSDVGI